LNGFLQRAFEYVIALHRVPSLADGPAGQASACHQWKYGGKCEGDNEFGIHGGMTRSENQPTAEQQAETRGLFVIWRPDAVL
jgi:hypothetical protein